MKICCLTVLFSLFATIGLSQVVAIQNDMVRGLGLCIDNYLTVAVEGLASDNILLSTDNGSIVPDKSRGAGHYIYHASTAGPAIIYVKKQKGNRVEKIDSVEFRVRRMPILTPQFAGKSTGPLGHLLILTQLGLLVPGDQHADRRFPIKSYSIAVYRLNREIFRRKLLGPWIDEATHYFFHNLRNNDQLKFENIIVEDCDGELRQAEPIEIIVKDALEYANINQADSISVENPVTGEYIQNRLDNIFKLIRESK